MLNGAKTSCPRDHRYSERNTYIDLLGKRHCRRCDALRHQRARRREKHKRATHGFLPLETYEGSASVTTSGPSHGSDSLARS